MAGASIAPDPIFQALGLSAGEESEAEAPPTAAVGTGARGGAPPLLPPLGGWAPDHARLRRAWSDGLTRKFAKLVR